MLLLFPLLAFFFVFVLLPPSLLSSPLPPSLQNILITLHQHHEDRTQLLEGPHVLNQL